MRAPRAAAWTVGPDGRLPAGFDVAAYSRMKHGSREDAARMAAAVAAALAGHRSFSELLTADPPVFLVAYASVVPACHLLSEHVASWLSRRRGPLAPAPVERVAKSSVTRTDYARSSAEDRARELRSIRFTLPAVDLTGRAVVVVDDARVTGAAESVMADLVATARPRTALFAYVMDVDESYGRAHPDIERRLNEAAVTSILDMVEPLRAGGVVPTIRFVKQIVAADEDLRRRFFSLVGPEAGRELRLAIDRAGIAG